jgi:hypothetical protein
MKAAEVRRKRLLRSYLHGPLPVARLKHRVKLLARGGAGLGTGGQAFDSKGKAG